MQQISIGGLNYIFIFNVFRAFQYSEWESEPYLVAINHVPRTYDKDDEEIQARL
jgi:hypothetical protein